MTVDKDANKKSQHDRFIETARALGCDEDEAVFDGKLKAIVRQKPKSEKPKQPKASLNK